MAGRNSFTEGQAKSKIEEAGFSNVTELKKDEVFTIALLMLSERLHA